MLEVLRGFGRSPGPDYKVVVHRQYILTPFEVRNCLVVPLRAFVQQPRQPSGFSRRSEAKDVLTRSLASRPVRERLSLMSCKIWGGSLYL